MTKIFCDRCKKEITNDIMTHQFHMYEGDSCEFTGIDICDDCHKAFESFMKMEDGMSRTNRPTDYYLKTRHDLMKKE